MKKFNRFSTLGLIMVAAVICLGLVMIYTANPKSSIIALAGIPFVFGAVKIRDNMNAVRTVTYAHSSATVKDTVYLINGIPMLAVNSADANATNVFVLIGLIEYAKLSAQAWTAGQKVYWDDGNSRFTTVSSGNTLAGVAAEAAANPTSTGILLLNPFLVGTNQMESAITDPGNAGAIPITGSGVCAMTSAGAETRTLAAPTYLGQQLALILDTRVGDVVVTCATTVNQTGNNTLTFGAAADACLLVAMSIGGDLRWRIMGNDGVALSSV
jgi:predicted RecA/RadA family phage recombinase